MSSKAWRYARRARTGRMGRSQMLRKLVVALSVLSLGAAACTQDTQEGRASQPVPRETLLLGTEAGPLVVQVPSGSVLFERPGAVASLGGSWLVLGPPLRGRPGRA